MNAFFRTLMMLVMLLPTSVLASAMQDSLQRFFAQGIHHQGATAEMIEVMRWPNAKDVMQGSPMTWTLPKLNQHSSRIALIAEQHQHGSVRRWYVPVRVHWWADVVTVKQDLSNRVLLHASSLQVQKVDVAGHVGHWWKDISRVEGLRLTRPLRKGSAVYSTFVKRPPLIQRGDSVTIIAKFGHLSVRAEGRAMRAGSKGDRLLVMNLKSKQRLQAVVVNASTVMINKGDEG